MAKINVTTRSGKLITIDGKVGHTLMENLRDNDLDVEAACGGSCSCATCHIFVDATWLDKLPKRSDDELELVEQTTFYKGNNSRLSCQIKFTEALDGIDLTVAPAE